MTRAQSRKRQHRTSRTRRRRLMQLVAVPVVFSLMNGVAWAYWNAASIAGGNGMSQATAVNQGATPTASPAGHAVTVTWAATTLTSGQAVTGYKIKRYDADTSAAQTILAACTGTIIPLTCTESGVPDGSWQYTVTPVFATNWQGIESAGSSAVTVITPTLTLTPPIMKPGTTLTGTAAAFIGGETLVYRLDNPTSGTVLTGSLAGSPTPATVPGGGGGAAVVTVPAGTSDGAHTVYAVTSPRGDTAAVGIVVDGTAPPLPVLTLTPAAVSGDSVSFAYTEAEGSATVDCRLDAAAFAPCASPVNYAGLTESSHTFEARATDQAGNVSASTSHTWAVHLDLPSVLITFPTPAGLYNDNAFNDGCGTASNGDVCGTASDIMGISAVNVSLRSQSTGLYWNGTTFISATEVFLAATGTTSWSYAMAAASFPAEDSYTLRVQATDGAGNLGDDSRTMTIDRTAPAAPTLTTVPPSTSGPAATFTFTTTDPTAVFQCRLDGAAWTSCSSPQAYSNLPHGSHTFDVRAVDSAGNAGVSASTTWAVDATAPTAVVTFPATTSYNLSGWAAGCGTPATGDVCGTAGDVGSGLTSVAVSFREVATNMYWNGSAFAAPSETWLGATGTASWSYLFAGAAFPADGGYTVRWLATDAVGNANTGGVDLTLDTAPPPVPQIVQVPSNPSSGSVQFGFTNTEAGTGAECRMDSGAWATCTSPVDYTLLAESSHTFEVRATDPAGNVSASTSHTWAVHLDLPTVLITYPAPAGLYNNSGFDAGCGTASTGDVCGTASDIMGISAVNVSLRRQSTGLYWNGTTFTSATEVFLPATGTTSWSYAMAAASFPAEDSYTLRARAADGTGNLGYNSRTFTFDRTAPVVGTTFPLAGGRYNNAIYNTGCNTSLTGDICGTTSDALSGVSTVEISVQRASTGLYWNGTTFTPASQNWIAATGTTSWSYALAAASFPTGADDTYTLVVRATDTVGNVSTATTAFVIDRSAPTAVGFSTTNIATARWLNQGDTFTLYYSEAIDPSSISIGWGGATPLNVQVRAANNAKRDTLTVWNAANTTQLPLGVLDTQDNYVTGPVTFGATGTLTMSGSSLTITLGTPNTPTNLIGAGGGDNVRWTPAIGATDVAGNAVVATLYVEGDNDDDF